MVWYPSICGIMISIRTIAISGLDSTSAIASLPVVAVSTFMPRRSSTLRQREDVAGIVVDQQRGLADQVLVGTVELLQHSLLLDRQFRDHTMQKQRGFVEQPFRRFHALDHDASGHGVQFRVFLDRELPAGEHHDRNIGQRSSLRIRSSTSKPLMSGSRKSSTTQSQGLSRKVESAPAPVPVVTISMSL